MTKGKPISEDLRWAIVRMHTAGVSIKTISAYTDTKQSLDSNPAKEDRAYKTSYFQGCRFSAGHPRPYLRQVSRRATTRTPRDLRTGSVAIYYLEGTQTKWIPHEKLTRVAIERSATKRASFKYKVGLYYQPYQLVFVDESSCDRRTSYRGRAWAFRGNRAVRKAFFIRGKRYSVLPAISLDGILYVSIVEGSFNAESFTEFIDGLLDKMNPFPGPNSVIVMDNCRIHKAEIIREMIEER